jgi:hypothetical protein
MTLENCTGHTGNCGHLDRVKEVQTCAHGGACRNDRTGDDEDFPFHNRFSECGRQIRDARSVTS